MIDYRPNTHLHQFKCSKSFSFFFFLHNTAKKTRDASVSCHTEAHLAPAAGEVKHQTTCVFVELTCANCCTPVLTTMTSCRAEKRVVPRWGGGSPGCLSEVRTYGEDFSFPGCLKKLPKSSEKVAKRHP